MRSDSHIPRYNHFVRKMRARMPGGLRLGLSFFFLFAVLPSSLFASSLGGSARQLADRIASASGPGTLTLEITNRSSLDEKSVREIRGSLEAELRVKGVSAAAANQSVGTVSVVLSESLREYVWTAQIRIGSDPPRVVLISTPRPVSAASFSALPITLKKMFLFAQEQPILDAALVDMSGGGSSSGARLFILDPSRVAIYRQQSAHWDLEASLPILHSRTLPRDIRGRIFLRRDHLFDVYLPGVFCQSSAIAPIALNCSASDDPWPLSSNENANVRAFYAPARNFFTGVLSPGIGKISNVPPFYSAAALPRSNYTLWILTAIDGSIHMVDGFTDQAVRGGRIGSDLVAIHSACGTGSQILVTDVGDSSRDTVRAFEIPDRDPVAVSSPLEFEGPIVALLPDANQTGAIAIVKRQFTKEDKREGTQQSKQEDKTEDTPLYEANRVSITCGN